MRGDRPRDGHPGALRVQDAPHQRVEVLDARRVRHLLQRVCARAAKLDLAQSPRDEQSERSFLVAHQLLERPVKAEAGLHADRHHVECVRQHRLQLGPALVYQLVEPQDGQVEPDRHSDEKCQADRDRCRDQHTDRNPERAQSRGCRDAQRLQACRVETKGVTDEIELPAEVLGLCRWGQPVHLPCEPAPAGREEPFTQGFLQLEGDGALAEADVLACESLPGQHRRIARVGGDDPRHQQPYAGGRDDPDEDWKRVHVIAVRRRMTKLPIASMTAARPSMNQPSGFVNIGRK